MGLAFHIEYVYIRLIRTNLGIEVQVLILSGNNEGGVGLRSCGMGIPETCETDRDQLLSLEYYYWPMPPMRFQSFTDAPGRGGSIDHRLRSYLRTFVTPSVK
ncbi:hypothetical protein PVAR5_3927 [Paecilomyces variotii No. 5]|uniref:Uncharacterized protein n=1 Tax=Byssochlamys spectabilis (strain No. 5 / NBRC 109023) TaxID=1356009 RepID=V5HZ33_BYSSN|nr:hypothetical protein PVAR5_3927 [Paecilomyces variotii No. 5]